MTETAEVRALYAGVQRLLDAPCANGRKVGDCKHGVYLFYDYDGEPIYVGQTSERLRVRIRRHLTNQRTDAVAMSVLDPFEVAEVEMWPFWDLSGADARDTLDRAEFTVFELALERSRFDAILNEDPITGDHRVALPQSVRRPILGQAEWRDRKHPDIRLARRARTIANLAKIISERKVKTGLRRTLVAQAKRLEALATARLREIDP